MDALWGSYHRVHVSAAVLHNTLATAATPPRPVTLHCSPRARGMTKLERQESRRPQLKTLRKPKSENFTNTENENYEHMKCPAFYGGRAIYNGRVNRSVIKLFST